MDKQLKNKAISIKGKEYVQVKDRILYLSENVKDYSISTDYQYFPERKMWVVKATLKVGENIYTGLAQEIESDNYKEVNHTSALENCETSAVGRACAMYGLGVIDSIASVDEMNKAKNRTGYNQASAPTPSIDLKKCLFVKINYNDNEGRELVKKLKGKWLGEKKCWAILDTPENRLGLESVVIMDNIVNAQGEIIEL